MCYQKGENRSTITPSLSPSLDELCRFVCQNGKEILLSHVLTKILFFKKALAVPLQLQRSTYIHGGVLRYIKEWLFRLGASLNSAPLVLEAACFEVQKLKRNRLIYLLATIWTRVTF